MQKLEEPAREADPREGEEWFLRLPRSKQLEVQASWDRARTHDGEWRIKDRARLKKAALDCALLMLVPIACADIIGPSLRELLNVLAFGLVIGAVLGVVVHCMRAERFQCAILGLVAFVVVQSTCFALFGFATIVGGLVAGRVYAGYGALRETRAMDW